MKYQTHWLAFAMLLVTSSPLATAQSSTISAPAQVEPFERAELFAKASGFVAAVHVDIGDLVKKGELLADLSIPEMNQQHLQKKALLEQADAAIQQADSRVASAKSKVAAAKANMTASESEVAAARAHLEKHKADIAFAKSQLSRITTLVASRSINASLQDEKQQQFRAANAALSGAEADVQSAQSRAQAVASGIQVAQAAVKQAEADFVFARSQRKVAKVSLDHTLALMEYAKIQAPFDGRISYRGIDTGDFVISAASSKALGASLFTLNRVGNFRIVFDVPESSATQVKIGQQVELVVDSVEGHVFKGYVKRTTGELDKRTRTLRVEAEVKDSDLELRPGMYGTAIVTIENQSTTGD